MDHEPSLPAPPAPRLPSDALGGLSNWDRRLVTAFEAVDRARQSARWLRAIAALVASAALVGGVVYYFFSDASPGPFGNEGFGRLRLGQFLINVSLPLAFAAIVYALSFLVEIGATRLDLDIVLADDDRDPDDE